MYCFAEIKPSFLAKNKITLFLKFKDMNTFIQRGIKEHIRQNDIRRKFVEHNRIMTDVIQNADFAGIDVPDYLKNYENRCLILLSPLIEVAWADGSLRTREMNAIFKVADAYGLTESEEIYTELIDSMTSRAMPFKVDMLWLKFHELWRYFKKSESEVAGFCLMMQARYVAEHCSNDSINYLRGDCISPDESEVLLKILGELHKAKSKTFETEENSNKEGQILQDTSGTTPEVTNINHNSKDKDISELLPLVPLVKVAWAEGRITKREKEILFKAAEEIGIYQGSLSYQRLSDWLEFHPTDEFYSEALELLYKDWMQLPEEERVVRRLDLITDCVSIAEASGGTSNYPAGGPRICGEEIEAVKRISEKMDIRSGITV